MKERIKEIIRGKVLLLGIGNQIKGDDAVGPLLIKNLEGKVKFHLMNAEISPENYLGKIVKLYPETIIVIDAMEFGGNPGEIRIIEPGELQEGNISTHNISPKTFVKFINDEIETNVIFIGIQPQSLKLGTELSREVNDSMSKLVKIFLELEKEPFLCQKN